MLDYPYAYRHLLVLVGLLPLGIFLGGGLLHGLVALWGRIREADRGMKAAYRRLHTVAPGDKVETSRGEVFEVYAVHDEHLQVVAPGSGHLKHPKFRMLHRHQFVRVIEP